LEWFQAVKALPARFSHADVARCDTTALDGLLTHLVECRDLQQS
jgi:hypothetical protein